MASFRLPVLPHRVVRLYGPVCLLSIRARHSRCGARQHHVCMYIYCIHTATLRTTTTTAVVCSSRSRSSSGCRALRRACPLCLLLFLWCLSSTSFVPHAHRNRDKKRERETGPNRENHPFPTVTAKQELANIGNYISVYIYFRHSWGVRKRFRFFAEEQGEEGRSYDSGAAQKGFCEEIVHVANTRVCEEPHALCYVHKTNSS